MNFFRSFFRKPDDTVGRFIPNCSTRRPISRRQRNREKILLEVLEDRTCPERTVCAGSRLSVLQSVSFPVLSP